METEGPMQSRTKNMTKMICHIKNLNQMNIHKELGLNNDETVNISIRLEDNPNSIIGKTVLQYTLNYGEGLRDILKKEKYLPDKLNVDVWSNIIDYVGIRFGVYVNLDIYFANLHEYWEPIWVVQGVKTSINGLKKYRGPNPHQLRSSGWPTEPRMFIYITNIVRNMNRKSLGCPYLGEIKMLVNEYDDFTSYVIEFMRKITPEIKILLNPSKSSVNVYAYDM